MNISVKFNKIEILDKCRICLLKSGTWLISSLYGEDKIDIRTIYESYTGIKVEEEDNMPKKLCIGCLDDLIATRDFIEKCKTADTVLHSLETMLANGDPTSYKVVVIQGESTIEFEYDDCVEPCNVVEEGILKDVHSDILNAELTKIERIDCDPNELVVNTCSSSNIYYDSLVFQQDTIDVQKLCTDLVSSTDMIKKEYEAPSLEEHSEMNLSDGLVLLNGFNGSWEELINSNDEEHDISNSSKDDKEIDDIKIKTWIRNIPKNKICSICLTGFRRRDTLINHMRTHTRDRPFKCSVCTAKFLSSSNLIRHSRVHTGEKPYVCDVCGKGVTQSTSLRKHKELHTGKTNMRSLKHILCSYCGLTFTTNGKFKLHLVNTPGHIDLENEDTRNKILATICKICGRYFDTKYNLNHHMAIHAGIKNYLCSYCGKKFQTKAALNIHSLLHTGERPYKCEYCGKAFTQRSGLKFHRYIHTGAKPYKCEVCCKRFKQSTHLNYHSLLHTGEKRHSCTYCGKKFALKGNLKQHMASHTDVTPYYCPNCNRGFKSSNNMRKHLKVHLKEKNVT